jgi:cyclic beta-1,2-glucan synthetase
MPAWQDGAPVRGELFSVDRLEQHAATLAAAQSLGASQTFTWRTSGWRDGGANPLADRLASNATELAAAYRKLVLVAEIKGTVTPAAAWLIDNIHLVDMQIHGIGVDLPYGYYAQLPKLADGPFAGLPRVFGAAWSFVAHTDSLFDPDMLHRYLAAYQAVQPLTIGELWAVPITLRIVLIENLRRVADIIVSNSAARNEADLLAERLSATDATANPAGAVLAGVGEGPLSSPFVVQLAHRLRGIDAAAQAASAWLDERLAGQGTTLAAAVQAELAEQAAFNATIRNVITSLRLIGDVDWTETFERNCLVDAVLARQGCYAQMDFASRNLYRTAVEALARGSKMSEAAIAEQAVSAARACPASDRGSDPGYHLLGGGRKALEAECGFRPALSARLAAACRSAGIGGFALGVVAAAMLILAASLAVCTWLGASAWWLAALVPLGIVPASDAAVATVNWIATRAFGARPLPGLELRDGIPPGLRTAVVMPTLLVSPASIAEQVRRLELHHLASHDGEVQFVLLSDWTDSLTEAASDDATLLALAEHGIARLNTVYGPAPFGARFILLHRRRIWNEGEGHWIGWERKRGKLHELNRLLRGHTDTTFLDLPGRAALARGIRYVVTVDSDTRMAHGVVRRLVGKMAHPLNAPRFDAALGRVVEGHGVLQPRVTPSLPTDGNSTLFQRVFSSMDGIDPYGAAASDVYQDMFGEGSYAGKGIYEVDAFELSLAGRVPDSTLLSHDLFEGMFARAGLASDVEMVEDAPTDYMIAALRQVRWARGDWQLVRYALPWLGTTEGAAWRNRAIPAIGRWKMLDNLRRTLSAPASCMALLAGWCLPPAAALIWTIFVVGTLCLPRVLPVVADILPRGPWISLRHHMRALGGGLRRAGAVMVLECVFLADQACKMGDAICRTVVRVFITRRHLLQWVAAAQTAAAPRPGLAGVYRRMAGGPAIGLVALLVASVAAKGVWLLALPFALMWIASPAVAHWVSLRSEGAHHPRASASDTLALRLMARRTWRYFETFVTPADHMLPPDNFQEDPSPVLARRTSPTNIGLYLLACVAACDFGWAGLAETTDRLEATLATLEKLARHRGHFLNWYGTQDLRPLAPAYVSTVDSGNLAGHLLALASACTAYAEAGPLDGAWRAGVADALALADASAEPADAGTRTALQALATAVLGTPASCPSETLAALGARATALAPQGATGAACTAWIVSAVRSLDSRARDRRAPAEQAALAARLTALAATATRLAMAMDFGFLRDPARKLLSIGYMVADDRLDGSCYDLLASEARLACYVAIAKGDVPAREWFRLGRTLTPVGDDAALVSWSGSMFEYLMPSLVMRAPEGSLLEQTARLVVRRQISYGTERGIPWGVSESAYNVRDREFTYQYSNFGVPGLGLKHGLGRDAVVAPYATALAAMVDAPAAVCNLARLQAAGGLGQYGFYEALDYTPSRLAKNQNVAIVRAFMAHHQGMSILAAADAVLGGIMRAHFHTVPMIAATELLLQERAPRSGAVPLQLRTVEEPAPAGVASTPGGRHYMHAHDPEPATHLLSNGRYSVMLTSAGSGYSKWQGLAVTRWREDATLDNWGSYILLRDAGSGQAWSAGLQPSCVEPEAYGVFFSEDRAEFARRDGDLTTSLQILVSAEDDSEVRRLTIANAGTRTRVIDITSYAELALIAPAADTVHPAFAKLFVETDFLPETGAITATRRRREPSEPEIWAAHLCVGGLAHTVETDRARFLGRGHGVRDAAASASGGPLSGTVGTVLDAVFALRCRVSVAPGEAAHLAFWTMVAPTREALIDSIDKHRDEAAFDRASMLAWTLAQVQLRHLGISPAEADVFQRLGGHLLFAGPGLRPASATIQAGAGQQSGLWGQGISGDLPILLIRIDDAADLDIVRQLLVAHDYLCAKQLTADLVILNEHPSSYVQDLQVGLESLVGAASRLGGVPGSVHLLRADLLAPATTALLLAVARVVLTARRGTLRQQLDRALPPAPHGGPRAHPSALALRPAPDRAPVPPLAFFNGHGGFTEDGRDYVVVLGPGGGAGARATPSPWVNVVANPGFGFQVSAEGGGFTWAGNSREHQLTPWSNDPVTDRASEMLYLRDTDTADLWCPTAACRRDPAATYVVRHGAGYSCFDRVAYGIASSLLMLVPVDDPVKIARLRLHNMSGQPRHLAVTAYAEWVLGANRASTAPFIVTWIDPETGAIFARNPWHAGAALPIAFADLGGLHTAQSGDRCRFIGRNGTLDEPEALTGPGMPPGALAEGRFGAGLDPCAVLQTVVALAPDASTDIVFLIGAAADEAAARALILRTRAAAADTVVQAVRAGWDKVLRAVQVKTPDPAMDIMLNGWLLYQTLSSRVWARAGFYQASGAYGFRDQLQDGMALTASCPALVRAHLLRAAGRQFIEGDVQHWWLPETGMGVRTRIADDCAWLATTVAHYVSATGDASVLDEQVDFLSAAPLTLAESDRFFLPEAAHSPASLYDHCARALDHSLALGAHGLPLMGTGDWNDGMNRVGEAGTGESVWLGWFLHAALMRFANLADARNDTAHAQAWRAHAAALVPALEQAWDGGWYLRAYFDDATPLGGHASAECQIDSLPQSWAVITGAGSAARAAQAMGNVARLLCGGAAGLVRVLTPPFDGQGPDPGYVGGYPPGIRENGGQYTHAALWAVMATALLGDGDQAHALFAGLNPINHALTQEEAARYRLEPYVAAADIYANPAHYGRGGWSWYTGSAGWMQRVGVESILGVRIEGNALLIDPCIPKSWPGFTVTLTWRSARYVIVVHNPNGVSRGVASVTVDGVAAPAVTLLDDGATHAVDVVMGG